MIWGDLLLDSARSKEALQTSLARTFGVDLSQVCVVDAVSDIPEPGVARVVCEQSLHGGQFPLRLSLYVYDGALLSSPTEIAQELARQLAVRCLVSDGQQDPYTMTLVTAEGAASVDIDVEKLDMSDEYWLA